jgi:hypothetical protein
MSHEIRNYFGREFEEIVDSFSSSYTSSIFNMYFLREMSEKYNSIKLAKVVLNFVTTWNNHKLLAKEILSTKRERQGESLT